MQAGAGVGPNFVRKTEMAESSAHTHTHTPTHELSPVLFLS